jgi:hypothetical protein
MREHYTPTRPRSPFWADAALAAAIGAAWAYLLVTYL